MPIKELILASLLAVAVIPSSYAANPQPEPVSAASSTLNAQDMTVDRFLKSLNFRTGKIVLDGNLATLDLPKEFVFLNSKDAERVLEAWGNPPSQHPPMGMVMPTGVSPFERESWGMTVYYEKSGYVSDEDASDINYADLLKDMQQDVRDSNKARQEQGYEPLELVGWAAAPHYDKEGKKLYWAQELKLGNDTEHGLNYDIRVLGRKGVLVLSFIAAMDQLPQIQKSAPAVLAMTNFNDGNRYADFNPDIDQVAAYGIGALIAGKAAAKLGLLAGALLLFKKLWMLPMLLIGWVFNRFRGKKKAEPVAASTALSEPETPAKTVMDMNGTETDDKK
jgi:uncharacterized membrane-anchored protein